MINAAIENTAYSINATIPMFFSIPGSMLIAADPPCPNASIGTSELSANIPCSNFFICFICILTTFYYLESLYLSFMAFFVFVWMDGRINLL